MKTKLVAATVLALGCAVGSSAFAQTCEPNQGALQGNSTVDINTCGAGDHLAAACSSLSPVGGAPDAIWSVTVGDGASGNITVTPANTGADADFDPYLLLMAGSCSGSSTCVIDADDNGPGQPESGAIPTTPGTYYLMVTDESGITSCGAATLAVGTLPVQLQNFTVD